MRDHRRPAPAWGSLSIGIVALVACCAFAPSPAAARTPGHSTSEPDPSPYVNGTAPRDAVALAVGADAQQVVDEHPAGTAFVIGRGVHRDFSVVPKTDDRFYAKPGAVLDGGHAVISAFSVPTGGIVNGVQIIGPSASALLVIRNYGDDPVSQIGTVQTSTPAGTSAAQRSSGWRLQWVEVTGSGSRGVSLSDQMAVIGCRIVGNARLGIGGGGSGITIADDVISDNGTAATRQGWEAGGIKTIGDNVAIEHDQITGNGAAGVWTDGAATGVVVSDSSLNDNTVGIHIEISRDVTVTGNTITGSLMQAVLVVASNQVSISGNAIAQNHGGIIVGGVRRTGPGGISLNNVTVSDNTVRDSGVTGVDQPLASGMVVNFDHDQFQNERFTWQGTRVTFAQWQDQGQEVNGEDSE